jgi:uncharacterized protein YbaR (Trm112 family)/ubiquinone/menaquinone biosynthesis C-methylase UbiE
MRIDTIKVLCCPKCQNKLQLGKQIKKITDDIVQTGILFCETCHQYYQIENGIPLMFDKSFPHYPLKKREMDGWISMYKEQGMYGTDDDADRVLPYLDRIPGREFQELWKCHAKNLDYLLKNFDWNDKKVLEVGACRCWIGRWLAEKGAHYIGSDLNIDELIGLGRAFFFYREFGLYLDRVQGDGEMLPFCNNTFDMTIIMSSLHHTTELNRMVHELCRVTKRGGLIFVFDEGFKPLGEKSNITEDQKKEKEKYGTNESVFTVPRYIVEFIKAGAIPINIEYAALERPGTRIDEFYKLLFGWGGVNIRLKKIL